MNFEAALEAAESALDYLESHDEAAYAEVGAVSRQLTDSTLTDRRGHSTTEPEETGIWCRVFANGAAGYRYAATLDEGELHNMADRVIRSAKHLGQETPAKVDESTIHRAIHDGWGGSGHLAELNIDRKRAILDAGYDQVEKTVAIDRFRAEYRDETLEEAILTSTGSVVRTTLDRVSLDVTVGLDSGPTIQHHVGATTGSDMLEDLPAVFETVSSRAQAASAVNTGSVPTGRSKVVFGPRATGQLFHLLSHYLEIDTVYMGSSPFDLGDQIAPANVSVHDTVKPGSWTARAYDAEGRPTQPVRLIEDGIVKRFLHTTASAVEEQTVPHGHVIPGLAFEHAPRVHARHLDIDSGTVLLDELLNGTTLFVQRFDQAQLQNQATRTKRTSDFPPSVLYGKNVDNQTPPEFDEANDQRIEFPVTEGFTVENGTRTEFVNDVSIAFSTDDLQTIDGVSCERDTSTGVCQKHKTWLPFGVCAPAMRMETRIDKR